MNKVKTFISFWLCFFLLLTAEPATGGDTTAKFGTWRVTSFSGAITIVDESRFRTHSWNLPADTEASGTNWIRVYSHGELEYSLAFKGVKGSPHPDGFRHGGTGRGEGGIVFGHDVQEESGPDGYHSRIEKTIQGTHSDSEMAAEWTLSGIIRAGHIRQTISGNGSIRAVRGPGKSP